MNKIDKKYTWSGKNIFLQYIDANHYTLVRDILKHGYYLDKLPDAEVAPFKHAYAIVNEWDDYGKNGAQILDNWSLLQDYYNRQKPDDTLRLFRGLSFKEKYYNAFVKLLNNIYTRKCIITHKPQSWSRLRYTAQDYGTIATQADAAFRKNAAGIILNGIFKYNEILDISYNNEREIISPPGILSTEICYAWCRLNNIFYYYLNNKYKDGLSLWELDPINKNGGAPYCYMYRYSDAQYKIKTLTEFVRIANQG